MYLFYDNFVASLIIYTKTNDDLHAIVLFVNA